MNRLKKTSNFIYFVKIVGLLSIIILSNSIEVQSISSFLILFLILDYFEHSRFIKTSETDNNKKQKEETTIGIDKISNLPNKYRLFDELEDRYLILVSIDKFVEINSVFGLKNGNLVLQKTAEHLKNISTEKEKIYYFENGIFAITFKEISYETIIQNIFSKELNITLNHRIINIDFTISISMDNKDKIINSLNALRYAISYNKPYTLYKSELENIKKKDMDILEWIETVKYSIQNDSIIPYAQAITDKYGNLVSYEILMRIKEGERIILPEEFLDKIKSTKYYKEMSKIIISKSFEFFEGSDINFSVNLSIIDIIDLEMQEFIIKKIKEFNVGHQVIFEITEDEAIEDFEIVKDFLKTMKKYSVRIAIDNFGNGYTNFLHLKELEIDYLKIDTSIIKNIARDFDTQNIITNIIDLAKKIDVTTVAEYVSNKSIFEITKELGIDNFQGYYFSQPKNMLKLEKRKDINVKTIID